MQRKSTGTRGALLMIMMSISALVVSPAKADDQSVDQSEPGSGVAAAITSSATFPDAVLDPETEAALAALQDYAGVTRKQALETFAFEEQYSLYATELELRYPNNFAGAWIDHANGGILVVAMTDPTVASHDVPAEVDGRVQFINVDRSLDELLTMSEALNAHIDEGIGGASPDLKNNGIWVEILESVMVATMQNVALTADVKELEGRGIPVTYVGLEAIPMEDSCSSTTNCNPLPAGAAISGPESCSSGFKVRRTSTGWDGMLTAKHCDTGVYTHSIYNVLTSTGGVADCCADVRFLRKYSSGSLALADDVYSFGTLKDMTGWANPVLDQTMCRGGRNSSDCGVVNNTNYSGHRFRVANLAACPGDSGGPHYRGSTAYGTHTGSSNVSQCPGPSNEISNAVKVGYALLGMGLTFHTN